MEEVTSPSSGEVTWDDPDEVTRAEFYKPPQFNANQKRKLERRWGKL
jgi:hypothetical protein